MFNYIKKRFIIMPIIIVCGIIFSGCGDSSENMSSEDSRVLAKINNYELTVTDFKSEVDFTLAKRYLATDSLKVKEELLENLIAKKVLLQEAQREDLDKDKAFMKEIERYWEQALLKSLLRKKSEELSRDIHVDKKEKAFEDWIADLRKKASVIIDRELLNEIEIVK